MRRIGAAMLVAALLAVGPLTSAQARAPFGDIGSSTHRNSILQLVDLGITKGCARDAFCPNQPVTRAQMASFLVRALKLQPDSSSRSFSDVAAGHAHAGAISVLAAHRITNGCGAGAFCPESPVTRAQMATFLTRAGGLPASGGPGFSDVAANDVHSPSIAALAAAGVTHGCGGTRFCPTNPVTRGQMASFLLRLLDRSPDDASSVFELYYSTKRDGSDARRLQGALVRGQIYVFLGTGEN
jgi:hypothetical protein